MKKLNDAYITTHLSYKNNVKKNKIRYQFINIYVIYIKSVEGTRKRSERFQVSYKIPCFLN